MKYAYRAIVWARLWIDSVVPTLESAPRSEQLQFVLQGYRTRVSWIEREWQDFSRNGDESDPIQIEQTAFAPGVLHIQRWSKLKKDYADFDMRLFTTQLTLALKFTLLYGASGDAKSLREAAIASHAKVQALAVMNDSTEHITGNAASSP